MCARDTLQAAPSGEHGRSEGATIEHAGLVVRRIATVVASSSGTGSASLLPMREHAACGRSGRKPTARLLDEAEFVRR